MLLEKQKKRIATVEEYHEFITNMVKKNENGKFKKHISYRRSLKSALLCGASMLFKTEDEEYDYIGKYGRGPIFRYEDIHKTFDKEEQDIIVEIAKKYGAFDY